MLVVFRVNRAVSNEERGKVKVGLYITRRKIHFKVVSIEYEMSGLLFECNQLFDGGGDVEAFNLLLIECGNRACKIYKDKQ